MVDDSFVLCRVFVAMFACDGRGFHGQKSSWRPADRPACLSRRNRRRPYDHRPVSLVRLLQLLSRLHNIYLSRPLAHYFRRLLSNFLRASYSLPVFNCTNALYTMGQKNSTSPSPSYCAMPCYGSMFVCLSACPSQVGVLPKWLKIRITKQRRRIA